VVDHTRVNVELGGEAGHQRFCAALGAHGLGQVLDLVPNHMAIAGRLNRWWWDVLENGHASRYATYFDVTWDPPERKLRNTILVPVLGDHYGRVLEAGQLRLHDEDGRLLVRYFDHEFPVDPRTYGLVLGGSFGRLGREFADLPAPAPEDRAGALRRHVEKEALIARLRRLDRGGRLAERVRAVDADVDRLGALLERQNYRLARWQTAGYELDYRRFFDINSLVALRMEDPEVFADTHVRIVEWLHAGVLDGVRIDHPDGLRDPLGYLRRLRRVSRRAWIVVEKILEPEEALPDDWPVAGTTGYDFLNLVLGVFVHPAGEPGLTETYLRFTGETAEYREVVHEAKFLVMREGLATDLTRLAELFVQVCEAKRRYRDYTRHELLACLRETIACLDVYRTYVRPGHPDEVSQADRARVREALEDARRRRPDLDPELFDFLGRILLLEETGPATAELVARFQQTSGPVMAKGVEDTAMYRYNRLVALNEVGGSPARFAVSPDCFHAACAGAAQRWPAGMVATSTHDTKRSEDVRARLAVLSEMPARWQAAVRRWARINGRHRSDGLPDGSAEYLLYQTLVGAWPITAERLLPYLQKALREAKQRTSWIAPDLSYETAVSRFVEGALATPEFLASLEAFLGPVIEAGWRNSLAMKLCCLTAPGVPDVYQGSELWDLSLVDPDNRRPVDYDGRRRALERLDALGPRAAAAAWARRADGWPKLLVTSRALRLRAERPEAFRLGTYEALPAAGRRACHAFAFCRGGEVVTVVPRLTLGLERGWSDTTVELPAGRWVDRLGGGEWAGGRVRLARLLAGFPVALLARAA
jgi:(1->4)-alpha-D-glucan 1-alpha-D-glucosylmutase